MKDSRKHISKLLVITLITINSNSYIVFANQEDSNKEVRINQNNEIVIPDAYLENLIRTNLNIYDREITAEDMQNLISLDGYNHHIRNLSGLEYATNLTYLNLAKNNIINIEPLSNLVNLEFLSLSENKIENIEPLKNLTNLDGLYLGYNNINNIEVISNFSKLKNLNIESNNLENIKAIGNLTELSYLNLDKNNIVDISSLENLLKLEQLTLSNNSIKDIKSLSNLKKLHYLVLNNNNIVDVNPISNCINISYITLENNKIKNIEAIGNLINIDELNLNDNQIELIGDLSNLKKVKKINLNNNKLSSMKTSKFPSSLENLSINYNELENLDGLEKNYNLISLYADNNKIEDISKLTRLINLKLISLNNNNISDITSLKELYRLESLNLSENKIVDLRPLENLDRLDLNRKFTAYNQKIKLPNAEVNNGSDYELEIENIYGINGEGIPINYVYINDIYHNNLNGYKINIPNVVKNSNVNIHFIGSGKNRNFSGNITQDIMVKTKPIEEAIEFNGISLDNNNLIIGEKFNTTIDVKGIESDVKKITTTHKKQGTDETITGGYSKEHKQGDKFIGSTYAHKEGTWELVKIEIELDNREQYSINREANLDLSNADFYVDKGEDVIDMPDENLQKVVRNKIGISKNTPLTKEKMKKLYSLEINEDSNVTNLKGLEHATNINYLNINNSNNKDIENIDVIGDIKELQQLYITQNTLKSTLFLNKLYNLGYLDISADCEIDVADLISNKNIYNLSLKKVRIKNEDLLSKMKTLNSLVISESNLTSLDCIKELKNLTNLYISGSEIEDISPILDLTKLKVLHLPENNIKSIEGIEKLENLTDIYLFGNQISSIPEGIKKLNHISNISIGNQNITNPEIITTGKVSIDNNLEIYGEKISQLQISDNGYLDNENKNINWDNIDSDRVVTASFTENIDNVFFQGTVRQPVVYEKSNEEPEVPNINLVDIKGHWAENQIINFINSGYVSGYDEDNTFRPENSITRAEFVKLLNRVFGLNTTSGKVFEDTINHWAKNEIDIAVTNKVVNGVSEIEFKPDEPITREQAAKMISNYKNIGDSVHDRLNIYNDGGNVSSWAKDAVEGVLEAGYMNGYSEDNTFRPLNNMTRAEAVSMLSRIKSIKLK